MWSAVVLSSLGDGIFEVALPLLALEYTRSALAISAVFVAGRAPALLFGLPMGTLADRVDRRLLVVTLEVVRFVALAAFGASLLLHQAPLATIYITAFVMGGLNLAFDVVCSAAVPSVVGRDELVRANAHLLNAEGTSENVVGQAIGGAALALGRSVPFLANAVALLASALILRDAVPANEPEPTTSTLWQDLVEGLRWFAGHRVLRLLTAVVASFALCQSIVFSVLALYGRQDLHLSASKYGFVLALSSLGLLIGGATATRLHDRLGAGRTLIVAGVVAASTYPVLAATSSAAVATLALLAETAMVIVGQTASRSLRQLLTPDAMQGRSSSAFFCLISGCPVIGAVLGGVLGSTIGLRGALVAAGVLQLAVLAMAGLRLVSVVGSSQPPVEVDLRDDRLADAEPAVGAPLA